MSNPQANESTEMISIYCEEILGVEVDLSGLQKGGIYYFKAEKSAKKIHEYGES